MVTSFRKLLQKDGGKLLIMWGKLRFVLGFFFLDNRSNCYQYYFAIYLFKLICKEDVSGVLVNILSSRYKELDPSDLNELGRSSEKVGDEILLREVSQEPLRRWVLLVECSISKILFHQLILVL